VAWLGRLWDERPLAVVIGLAIAVRLAAALLSRGYGMHDDHFFVVEVAQRWADGDWDVSDEMVAMRSLIYPWLHAVLFRALRGLGLDDPAGKMVVVRLLHGAWSLLSVWFGYRIALAISDSRKARLAGLLLAVFWTQPFMSVRNLIEVVCQPLLLAATWLLVRDGDPAGPRRGRDAFAAGLLLGLALVVRFQTLVLAGAAVLVLLALRRSRAALLLGTGVALAGAVVLGVSDWLGFGRPFASLLAFSPTTPIRPWWRATRGAPGSSTWACSPACSSRPPACCSSTAAPARGGRPRCSSGPRSPSSPSTRPTPASRSGSSSPSSPWCWRWERRGGSSSPSARPSGRPGGACSGACGLGSG
jgi:hypothetical protein